MCLFFVLSHCRSKLLVRICIACKQFIHIHNFASSSWFEELLWKLTFISLMSHVDISCWIITCAVIPSYTMLWLSRCFNCRLETVWSSKTVMYLALLGHWQESDRLRPCRCETLSFVLEHLSFLRHFKTNFVNSFCCIFIEGIS